MGMATCGCLCVGTYWLLNSAPLSLCCAPVRYWDRDLDGTLPLVVPLACVQDDTAARDHVIDMHV